MNYDDGNKVIEIKKAGPAGTDAGYRSTVVADSAQEFLHRTQWQEWVLRMRASRRSSQVEEVAQRRAA
jgi:hypothetical protein